MNSSSVNSLSKKNDHDHDLSLGQKGLWFLHQLDPYSDRYHMPLTFTYNPQVKKEELEDVLNVFIDRHDMLRSTFHDKQGQPVRRVSSKQNIVLPVENVSQLNSEELLAHIRKVSHQAFDLSNGPLIKGEILQVSNDQNILLLVFHHLIFDGASLKIMHQELEKIFHAKLNNTQLTYPKVTFDAFQSWQQQWMQSEDSQPSKSFWMQHLKGELPQLKLPIDSFAQSDQTIQGNFIKCQASSHVVGLFKSLANDLQCSDYLVWLIAYFAFLSRYTGEKDIVVGTPYMGRPETQFDELVGYFVNMLPLRNQLNTNNSFIELINNYKNTLYEALAHADYPLPQIIQDLGDSAQRGDQPLFQSSFIWTQVTHLKREPESYLGLQVHPIAHESGEQTLSLEMLVDEQTVDVIFKYRTHQFNKETVERIKDSFMYFIENLSDEPEIPIQEVMLVTEQEEALLIHELNQTQAKISPPFNAHGIFELQADRNPEAIAVSMDGDTVSYQQLNERANQWARYLLQQNFEAGEIVGLCVERSVDQLVLILAVFKAGCAYLPLDSTLPEARLKHMVEQCEVRCVLTQQVFSNIFNDINCSLIHCDDAFAGVDQMKRSNLLLQTIGLDDSAYIIYTSGSTGEPKGVVQTHRTLVNLVHAQATRAEEMQQPMKTLQFAPIGFDVSIQEMVTSWYSGSELVMISETDKQSLNTLPQRIDELAIERFFVPPALLNWLAEQWIEKNIQPKLRSIIVAGETLEISTHLKKFMHSNQDCQLWNHYGPTETHVVTMDLVDVATQQATQSIGSVIANTSILLLDEHMQIVPYGVVGEIYIAGAGVSPGYINNANLTQERFVQHPLSDDETEVLYKTGDLGRYYDDNKLAFIGRVDDQVQIRGFRIELNEIEQQLMAFDGVEYAVVVCAGEKEHKRLVAFLVAQEKAMNQDQQADMSVRLKTEIQASLPDYMVPSTFVYLSALPLTANGKIDKSVLVVPSVQPNAATYIQPETETERCVQSIWAELLAMDTNQISADANFFELGGHSLLVAQMINLVQQKLAIDVTYKAIFNFPQLHDLSLHLQQLQNTAQLLDDLADSEPDQIEEMEW